MCKTIFGTRSTSTDFAGGIAGTGDLVRILVCFGLGIAGAYASTDSVMSLQQARDRLLEIHQVDQRTAITETDPEVSLRVRQQHVLELAAIVERFGWPTLEMFGEKACTAAFLVVQHAGFDPVFQEAMLKRMTDAVLEKRFPARYVAYLEDRIAVGKNLPQLYGTQGRCVSAGLWKPLEIGHPLTVDLRRQAFGLGALADYTAMMSEGCR